MRRAAPWIVAAAVALVAGRALSGWLHVRRLARYGVAVTAKQMCSCIFVDGRDEAGCRGDMPEGTEHLRVAVDRADDTVHARNPFFLVERRAHHHEGTGCTLE